MQRSIAILKIVISSAEYDEFFHFSIYFFIIIFIFFLIALRKRSNYTSERVQRGLKIFKLLSTLIAIYIYGNIEMRRASAVRHNFHLMGDYCSERAFFYALPVARKKKKIKKKERLLSGSFDVRAFCEFNLVLYYPGEEFN